MAAELLAIVEVDWGQRVRCQAPGCTRSVHKAVHVIADSGRLLVYGSSCSAEHFGFGNGSTSGPRYGSSKGRKLTEEERAMLTDNTAALVALMEAEHAAELVRVKAEEEARAAQVAHRLAGPPRAWDRAAWPQPLRASGGTDPLSKWREQEAMKAARSAMVRVPELARFSASEVRDAMVQAKARYLAHGLKLDAPGSRQAIEGEALALLQERLPGGP